MLPRWQQNPACDIARRIAVFTQRLSIHRDLQCPFPITNRIHDPDKTLLRRRRNQTPEQQQYQPLFSVRMIFHKARACVDELTPDSRQASFRRDLQTA